MSVRPVLCTCAKNEDAYIDEWIQYYVWGIGFSLVIIYDNSEANSLCHLPAKYGRYVEVIHFPMKQPQIQAFNDCVQRFKDQPDVWIALFDVDEYLVLKQHDRVADFIALYANAKHPGIVLHWVYFGNSGLLKYIDEPVTQRFTRRENNGSGTVKSIVHAASVQATHVHEATYHANKLAVNTDFTPREGAKAVAAFPVNVAHLNHYYMKTLKEFKQKKARTDVFFPEKPQLDYTLECTNENLYSIPLEDFDKTKCREMYDRMAAVFNEVFDDSAARVYTAAHSKYLQWKLRHYGHTNTRRRRIATTMLVVTTVVFTLSIFAMLWLLIIRRHVLKK